MKKVLFIIGLIAFTSCSKNEETLIIEQTFTINTSCGRLIDVPEITGLEVCTTEIILLNNDNDTLKNGYYVNAGTSGARSWSAYAHVLNGEIKVFVRHNNMSRGFTQSNDIISVEYLGDGKLSIDFTFTGINMDQPIFKYSNNFTPTI